MAALPFATHSLSCSECGLTSRDLNLLANHSCDVQQNGGRCEDFPCCGHESGDCNGLLYGSDEAIKESVYDRLYGRSSALLVFVCNGCGHEGEGASPANCPNCGSNDIDEDDVVDDYDPYYDDRE